MYGGVVLWHPPRPIPSPGVPRCPADSLPALFKGAGERQAFPRGPSSLRKADDIAMRATSPPAAPEKSHGNVLSPPLQLAGKSPALPFRHPPQTAASSFVRERQFWRFTKRFTFEDQHTPHPRGGPIAPSARTPPLPPFKGAPTFHAFSVEGSSSWQTPPASWRHPHFPADRPPSLHRIPKLRGAGGRLSRRGAPGRGCVVPRGEEAPKEAANPVSQNFSLNVCFPLCCLFTYFLKERNPPPPPPPPSF